MAEIFRNLEKVAKVPRGFYVIGMKKDQHTGTYMGVATWITKDIPLGGVRIKPSSRPQREIPGQTTLEPIQHSAATDEPANTLGAPTESKEPATTSVIAQRQTKTDENKPVERTVRKFSYVDPYDSYLL